jgi:hypothetical protein
MRERANMPGDAGSELLHGWIARAALRNPDKPWVVAAVASLASCARKGCVPTTGSCSSPIIQSSICFAISG